MGTWKAQLCLLLFSCVCSSLILPATICPFILYSDMRAKVHTDTHPPSTHWVHLGHKKKDDVPCES